MADDWPSKDPDEVLDFSIDWTDRLNGDTIATSTWTLAPSGLTQPRPAEVNSNYATIWLAEGIDGQEYVATNKITTAAGRTMEEVRKLVVDANRVI